MNQPLPTSQPTLAHDLVARDGYDTSFLGVEVPLPRLADVTTVLLPCTRFSALMRPNKRLAAVTGFAIDGRRLINVDRSGTQWRLDPRLPENQQTGERGLRPQ